MSPQRTVKIYLIYDLSGKKDGYVGVTSDTLRRRLWEHVHQTKHGSVYHCHNAIRKLNYKVGIKLLMEFEENEFSWQDAEKLEIQYHKDMCWHLWNMTCGGDGILDPSKEVRNKIALKKKKRDQERPGEFAGENNGQFGKDHSGEKNGMFGRRGKDHPSFGRVKSTEEIEKSVKGRKIWLESHPGILSGENHHMFGKRGEDSPNFGEKSWLFGKTGKNHPCFRRIRSDEELKKLRKPKSEEGRKNMTHAQHLRRLREKCFMESLDVFAFV